MRRFFVAAAVAVLGFVLAGPAAAVVRTLNAGENSLPPSGAEGGTFDDYFPHTLKIHEGDKVKVVNFGFHTATFLGGRPYSDYDLVVPDPEGGTYADTPDGPLGVPWYFEPLPKFIYNLLAVTPTQNRKVRSATTFANSGIALLPQQPNKPGTFTFEFPNTGTFTLVCLAHRNMNAKIIVKPPNVHVPTPAQQRATARAQMNAAWQEAIELNQTPLPGRTAFGPTHTVYAGIGDKVTLLRFLPEEISLPAGETLTLTSMAPQEAHNIVTGPEEFLNSFLAAIDLFPFPPGSPNQFSPAALYGSNPPGADGTFTYTGADQNGNGFFATPILDADPTTPLPQTQHIRFTTPGVYHLFCEIHGPSMPLTVTVTPTVG